MRTQSMRRTSPKDGWKNPFWIALVSYYAVMAMVGLIIPDDILTSNSSARQFSDFMASFIPQIGRLTALGLAPDLNRFYFSVLWAGSPYTFLVSVFLILSGRAYDYRMWTAPLRTAVLSISFLLGLFVWTQMLWTVNADVRMTKILFGSAVGRAFGGQLVFCTGVTLGLAGAFVWTLGWITGYIPRRIKEKNNG